MKLKALQDKDYIMYYLGAFTAIILLIVFNMSVKEVLASVSIGAVLTIVWEQLKP